VLRIHIFLGLLDPHPDPLPRVMDLDPALDPAPAPVPDLALSKIVRKALVPTVL
jgi:hypothetical protein